MWLSKFIFIFVLVAFVTPQCRAQQDHLFFAQLAQSITRQQPKWTLVKKRLVPTANIAYYEWKSGKSSVAAMIFMKESSDAATATLESLSDVLGEIKLTDKLANLGDDNYLWKPRYTKGSVGVDFRKGRFAVHVAARNLAEAKLFAQIIANMIDAT